MQISDSTLLETNKLSGLVKRSGKGDPDEKDTDITGDKKNAVYGSLRRMAVYIGQQRDFLSRLTLFFS